MTPVLMRLVWVLMCIGPATALSTRSEVSLQPANDPQDAMPLASSVPSLCPLEHDHEWQAVDPCQSRSFRSKVLPHDFSCHQVCMTGSLHDGAKSMVYHGYSEGPPRVSWMSEALKFWTTTHAPAQLSQSKAHPHPLAPADQESGIQGKSSMVPSLHVQFRHDNFDRPRYVAQSTLLSTLWGVMQETGPRNQVATHIQEGIQSDACEQSLPRVRNQHMQFEDAGRQMFCFQQSTGSMYNQSHASVRCPNPGMWATPGHSNAHASCCLVLDLGHSLTVEAQTPVQDRHCLLNHTIKETYNANGVQWSENQLGQAINSIFPQRQCALLWMLVTVAVHVTHCSIIAPFQVSSSINISFTDLFHTSVSFACSQILPRMDQQVQPYLLDQSILPVFPNFVLRMSLSTMSPSKADRGFYGVVSKFTARSSCAMLFKPIRCFCPLKGSRNRSNPGTGGLPGAGDLDQYRASIHTWFSSPMMYSVHLNWYDGYVSCEHEALMHAEALTSAPGMWATPGNHNAHAVCIPDPEGGRPTRVQNRVLSGAKECCLSRITPHTFHADEVHGSDYEHSQTVKSGSLKLCNAPWWIVVVAVHMSHLGLSAQPQRYGPPNLSFTVLSPASASFVCQSDVPQLDQYVQCFSDQSTLPVSPNFALQQPIPTRSPSITGKDMNAALVPLRTSAREAQIQPNHHFFQFAVLGSHSQHDVTCGTQVSTDIDKHVVLAETWRSSSSPDCPMPCTRSAITHAVACQLSSGMWATPDNHNAHERCSQNPVHRMPKIDSAIKAPNSTESPSRKGHQCKAIGLPGPGDDHTPVLQRSHAQQSRIRPALSQRKDSSTHFQGVSQPSHFAPPRLSDQSILPVSFNFGSVQCGPPKANTRFWQVIRSNRGDGREAMPSGRRAIGVSAVPAQATHSDPKSQQPYIILPASSLPMCGSKDVPDDGDIHPVEASIPMNPEYMDFRKDPQSTDVVSFMAAGVQIRHTQITVSPAPALMDDPMVTEQEHMMDPDDDDDDSTDESSSTSDDDPPWRNFYVYTVHQPPVQVSLNMVGLRLQQHQCARALGWPSEQLCAKYQVIPCPRDLLQSRMRGMLARHHEDPPEIGPLAMVLIDAEFHPPPPSWDAEVIRTAMFVPRHMTNHQFLESMHLLPYCRYARSPCLLIVGGTRINLDTVTALHVHDGMYIRIVLPPPNPEDEVASTRCIAMACYQDIDQEFFSFFGDLVEEHNLWSMPNPSQILQIDSSSDSHDDDADVVELLQRRGKALGTSQPELQHHHTGGTLTSRSPGIQATPGQQNAWQLPALVSHTRGKYTQPVSRITNSQRSGRKNPEDDPPSGLQKQPASRALKPDKQPAARSQEPVPRLQLHDPARHASCGERVRHECWHPRDAHHGGEESVPMQVKTTPFQRMPRVGEASKPGPAKFDTWVIGAINPTGLAGKAQQFKDLPPGIYAVSETHLSERGQARFREEIYHAKLEHKLYPGYRAPLKKESLHVVGGKHTGVAFLTTFPTRPITSGWDHELYSTSRIHAASFQVHNVWITGGVCYGYARDAESKGVQENTNRLLQELSKQVFHGFKGPAFIAGDFNQVPGVLSETIKWEQSGWKDVKTWADETFGINPGVTCQFTSRKDFIYLSPELQSLMQSCSNSFDRWPDHSTLLGHFKLPSRPAPLPRWDRPANIDYTQMHPSVIAAAQCTPAPAQPDPTAQYAAVCTRFEQHVHACLSAKGKPGLQQTQKGRGRTLQRTFRRPVVAPVKPARQGDYQPDVHTWSLLHSRWITQCRRLQSYAKHVAKGSTTSTAVEHRAALWHAIRKALGFAGGFEHWWSEQAFAQPNMIPWIPVTPPDAALADLISQHFTQILTNMERQIINQRVLQAKRRRIEDTNRVFRDVRKPTPVPVSMLVAKASTQVTEIVDEGSVEVEDSRPIQAASRLESRHGPLPVIHIEENQVWFTSPHALLPGDELAVVELQGEVGEIHEAFLREWTARWDRHRHLPDDHWDEVIALTQTLLHADTMELEVITLERWKRAIRSKKATSVTGLDAVARKDLLAFPDALHLQLLEIFRVAEETGRWPKQMLQGAVHSLEKVPGAQQVSQYRPITVMPVVYRIYTSIRSRQVLQHLAKVTPPSLLGNIPGKHAATLWWTLQHRIEQSMYSGEPMTGAVSDLCKAFNHLPRVVTFQIAASMGVHPHIIRAWASSAVQLQRHFVVRGCPSAQVSSTTGFVEGCGMSVVGMVLVNTLIHAYMQVQHPSTLFTTYVDNYELQSATVEETTQALQSLDQFCQLLDVQLDAHKTYRWACDAEGRSHLRALQVAPVKSARDLGAHIQYTANQTNGTVLAKFRQLPDLWHKLARSHSPQAQKLKVLRVVAWPRILYSGAIVHIGRAHFDEARAGAFKALGMQKSGANAQVFLSLMSPPLSDPEFYALWHAVAQFRRHIPEEMIDITLYQAAITPARKRKPGPGGVVITRLEQICWTYVQQGIFRDGEGGTIHILLTPSQELKARMSRAWQHAVGRRWEHRKGFLGMRFVSASLSKIDTVKFSLDEVGFLQVAQTGAFYTAECLQHSGYTDDPNCAKCHAPDSIEHRHWHCPATAASRQLIPGDIMEIINRQEPCTREHGWMPEPPEVRAFKEALRGIPDTINKFLPHVKQRHYDLFCDGAGLDPKQPLSRVVAWGVVVAATDLQATHQPVAWGRVPGYWQTVLRAELTAFLSALQFGVAQGTSFAVWSDCEVVITRARRIQQDDFQVTANCSDHDLWTIVQQILPDAARCQLHHIKSHQHYADEEPWIQWACSANDMADAVAGAALAQLPDEVLRAQKAASEAVTQALAVIQHVHAHMVRVARQSVAQVQPSMSPVSRQPDSLIIRWDQIAQQAIQVAPEHLRFPKWMKILEWMNWMSNPGAPPRWLSWFELLASFQIFSGEWGVESTSRHNTWQMHKKMVEYDSKQMLRSWSAYVLHLLRLCHPGFKPVDGRPSNPRFACWAMGLLCEVTQTAEQQVSQWMDTIFMHKKITKMADLYLSEPASMECPRPQAPKIEQGLHRFWHGQR